MSRTPFAPLAAHLLDLLGVLGEGETLLIVGGFGLFLRRELRASTDARTLIERVPEARSTEDFDVLLRLELLADVARMTALRDALAALGYVPSTPMYQFKKPHSAATGGRDVKVDLLAPEPLGNDPALSVKFPRVKASGGPLHARVTPEAVAADEAPLDVSLEGEGSDGRARRGTVRLANPYTLLLMKLYAFRDEFEGRKTGDRRPYAAKHVRDLFTLVALLTEDEEAALPGYRARHGRHPSAVEAGAIVGELFGDRNAPGSLRLRETLPGLERGDVEVFLGVLRDTFGADRPS